MFRRHAKHCLAFARVHGGGGISDHSAASRAATTRIMRVRAARSGLFRKRCDHVGSGLIVNLNHALEVALINGRVAHAFGALACALDVGRIGKALSARPAPCRDFNIGHDDGNRTEESERERRGFDELLP